MKKLTIQSLLFARGKWTPAKAAAWLKKHNYKTPPVDANVDFLRYRQASPAHFRKGSFITKELSKDGTIKAIMAHLKTRPNKISPQTGKRRTLAAGSSAPKPNKKRPLKPIGTSAPQISPVLVRLGTVKKIELSTKNHLQFGSRPHWDLFANDTGKCLYIFEHSKHYAAKSAAHKAQAVALYKRWSDFEPDTEYTIRPRALYWKTDKSRNATAIVYRSDKWTDKQTDYIHRFDQPVQITTGIDSKRVLRAVALIGKNIKITKRGIEG